MEIISEYTHMGYLIAFGKVNTLGFINDVFVNRLWESRFRLKFCMNGGQVEGSKDERNKNW